MKRRTTAAAKHPSRKGPPALVSLRSIYADALREVMADPLKAIGEHDPRLAALLASARAGAAKG